MLGLAPLVPSSGLVGGVVLDRLRSLLSGVMAMNAKSAVAKAIWKLVGRFADPTEQRRQARLTTRWSA